MGACSYTMTEYEAMNLPQNSFESLKTPLKTYLLSPNPAAA